MKMPNETDLQRFTTIMENLVDDRNGCITMPETFNGSQTFRSYQMYWYFNYGSWPGRLKKSCNKDRCVVHYREQGHTLTPEAVEEILEAKEYWGVTTALADKFGVSKARISQIRKKA